MSAVLEQATPEPALSTTTRTDRHVHWRMSFDGAVATLSMDVNEKEGIKPGYRLKPLYDLGVDISCDALQRIRFEHRKNA
jgi:benzoyl-CoA-dihydrodiol lyase